MKFKTYTKFVQRFAKRKINLFLTKGRFHKPVRLIKKTKRDQGNLMSLRLLIFESLQGPSENQSRHAKLLENHLKQKYQWNLLTRDF